MHYLFVPTILYLATACNQSSKSKCWAMFTEANSRKSILPQIDSKGVSHTARENIIADLKGSGLANEIL